ncbi:helix-turn-helix domain-containing protein [Paraburkholderia fungorum]|uniref:helix-turn-helix domain-containing protein n=1 Tax=Paraburkholderia fungorum TaxID=134537 RepID=UPI001FC801A0|nr:helix-turn-helix transcriptional regulator [Paraburkholderia fungorum]
MFGITSCPLEENSGDKFTVQMSSQTRAFGKALRKQRKARHITQKGLAIHARLDRTYISLLELGENSPTLDTLFALCRGLDMSLTELAQAIEAELSASSDSKQSR